MPAFMVPAVTVERREESEGKGGRGGNGSSCKGGMGKGPGILSMTMEADMVRPRATAPTAPDERAVCASNATRAGRDERERGGAEAGAPAEEEAGGKEAEEHCWSDSDGSEVVEMDLMVAGSSAREVVYKGPSETLGSAGTPSRFASADVAMRGFSCAVRASASGSGSVLVLEERSVMYRTWGCQTCGRGC